MRRQARIVDFLHTLVAFQPAGDGQRVVAMAIEPYRKGSQPAEHEPGRERIAHGAEQFALRPRQGRQPRLRSDDEGRPRRRCDRRCTWSRCDRPGRCPLGSGSGSTACNTNYRWPSRCPATSPTRRRRRDPEDRRSGSTAIRHKGASCSVAGPCGSDRPLCRARTSSRSRSAAGRT